MLLKRLYAYNHFGNILFYKIETCPFEEIRINGKIRLIKPLSGPSVND